MLLALDSNVFIAFLGREPTFFAAATEILQAVDDGSVEATYSSIVFGEVMRLPAASSFSLRPIKRFFDSLPCADYPAGRLVCIKAAELRRSYPSLKLPDAIHLATAMETNANRFITADKQLLGIAKQALPSIYLKEFRRA